MNKNPILKQIAHTSILAALLSAFGALTASAEPAAEPRPDASARGPVIELESRVTGNREQPQVFYLVPWQTPGSPELHYEPLSSQLQQVFGHLEREELRRQLNGAAAQTPSQSEGESGAGQWL